MSCWCRTSIQRVLEQHIVLPVRSWLAHTVTVLAADVQQEMHKLCTTSVNGTGQQQAGIGALEGGSGWLLKVATAAGEQPSLHLHKVGQEHSRRELVTDIWLKKSDYC